MKPYEFDVNEAIEANLEHIQSEFNAIDKTITKLEGKHTKRDVWSGLAYLYNKRWETDPTPENYEKKIIYKTKMEQENDR